MLREVDGRGGPIDGPGGPPALGPALVVADADAARGSSSSLVPSRAGLADVPNAGLVPKDDGGAPAPVDGRLSGVLPS